jgi:hypothetical protein
VRAVRDAHLSIATDPIAVTEAVLARPLPRETAPGASAAAECRNSRKGALSGRLRGVSLADGTSSARHRAQSRRRFDNEKQSRKRRGCRERCDLDVLGSR